VELHHIAIRAVFVYLVLLGLIRLSGKRTVAEATTFSFVLALILGDMIDDALWAEVPVAQFVVAAGTLAIVHLLVSWVTSRNEGIERVVCAQATPILLDGRPHRRGLRDERMSDKELAAEVRHHAVDREDWPEVQAAHIEASGALSLLKAGWARPVQRRDADAVRKARTP
jgi:uncharacterized membrane protein YcaP (DUF421 family)